MRTLGPSLIAVPLILAAGWFHGRWTDRWMPSRAVEAAVARLQRVPTRIGTWQGQDLTLTDKAIEVAGIDGYVMRRYEDPTTQAVVSVLLVCGRPGPIAAHTPEVCYGGAGYEMAGQPAPVTIATPPGQPPAEFFVARFTRSNPTDPSVLRLLWSWSGDGTWETAENPRLSFARHRCLYKLYLVRELPGDGRPIATDRTLDFAQLLLPELQTALFSGESIHR